MFVVDLTSTYQYLFAVLVGLPPVVGALVTFRDQRSMMWLAGLFLTALTPLIVFFNDDYWNPVRLGRGPIGIEDFLLNFSIGSLAWLAAVLPLRRRVTVKFAPRLFALRFLLIFVCVSVLLNALQLIGLSIMSAAFIAQLACVAVLLVVRPELWRLATSCLVIYAPYYCTVLYIVSFLADGFFHNLWNGSALWPLRLFGLPIQELLWAVSFPPAYVLAIAYAADARVRSSPRKPDSIGERPPAAAGWTKRQ